MSDRVLHCLASVACAVVAAVDEFTALSFSPLAVYSKHMSQSSVITKETYLPAVGAEADVDLLMAHFVCGLGEFVGLL